MAFLFCAHCECDHSCLVDDAVWLRTVVITDVISTVAEYAASVKAYTGKKENEWLWKYSNNSLLSFS